MAYGWLDRPRLELEAQASAAQLANQELDPMRLRRSELELLGERYWPRRHHTLLEARDPGPQVAFLTVANQRFFRGLEALLLSLRAVYPRFSSPLLVAHDGSLGPFAQRRLRQIVPQLAFVQPDTSWASRLARDSANRERIGLLGYLNGHALSLRGYRRVLVLDADLLITGPLDPLWAEGDGFRAVPDCGDRPWAAVSPTTRRPVLNSGVLSLPGPVLNDALELRLRELILHSAEPACPLLDRFADQKVWNLLLADQPLEWMPLNFNCNVKYLVRYLGGCTEGLSVLHFAGPKPWLTWPWAEPQPHDQRPSVVLDHLLWNRHHRQQLMAWRLGLHRQALATAPPLPAGPAVLVPTPQRLAALPAACSRHLVFGDPPPFSGSWPDVPAWPQGWWELLERAAPVQLWAPFAWEPALRELPLPAGVVWRWALIEAPFSPELGQGDDLIAEDGLWAGGFEPWCEPLVRAVARAARRRLEAEGAGPVQSDL
ncbi:MAG: hypothetical protein EA413_00745 [Cyanobium sp. PLM2.Bin73]|nr:MAG: hypothetical protein EA413_00745 [Cyanobium sp. PLM2.Bin73]